MTDVGEDAIVLARHDIRTPPDSQRCGPIRPAAGARVVS
jgi:hypothetical protein